MAQVEQSFRSVPDFEPSQMAISIDRSMAVAFDERTRNVCFVNCSDPNTKAQMFAPDDVLAAEIIEDGLSVTSTSRGSQFVGMAVGGALLGGVGAVVGGLSAKTTSTNKAQRIDLKIVVNDSAQPVRVVAFLVKLSGIEKTSNEYTESRQKVFHWHALLSLVVQQPVRGA